MTTHHDNDAISNGHVRRRTTRLDDGVETTAGSISRQRTAKTSVSEIDPQRFIDNDQALLDDPCRHWKPGDAQKVVDQFIDEHQELSKHRDLLMLAARTLDYHQRLEELGLAQEDYDAVKYMDTDRYWKQSESFKADITNLCIAAVIQGWTQAAINGANLTWPKALKLGLHGCNPYGEDAWIFAILNASTYFSASMIGCSLSDPLSDKYLGRRGPICFSAVVILVAAVGGAASQTWREYLVFRVLLGIGMGCKAAVTPVFAAEIAPAANRGSLVMNWQVCDALGIMLGFAANLALAPLGPDSWRAQTIACGLPTVALLARLFVAPDSPRWYLKRGKYLQAFNALLRLRRRELLAARELLQIHLQMRVEIRSLRLARGCLNVHEVERGQRRGTAAQFDDSITGPNSKYWHDRVFPLVTLPRNRRALRAAVVCMISQQLCGVNVLIFYSSTLFCHRGEAPHATNQPLNDRNFMDPLKLSLGLGAMNFLFSFPAYGLIDRLGRRSLLLLGLPFMTLMMMGVAVSTRNSEARNSVIGFSFAFMFFYSWTMGPVPFTYAAEVFPLENRLTGMSLAVATNFLGAGILTIFVPILVNVLGDDGLFSVFTGLNALAFIAVYLPVPETSAAAVERQEGTMNSISLEQMIYIFAVKLKRHVRYQLTVVPKFWLDGLVWVVQWIWKFFGSAEGPDPRRPHLERLYKWDKKRDREQKQEEKEKAEEKQEVSESPEIELREVRRNSSRPPDSNIQ